jgi:hypothetical protein
MSYSKMRMLFDFVNVWGKVRELALWDGNPKHWIRRKQRKNP